MVVKVFGIFLLVFLVAFTGQLTSSLAGEIRQERVSFHAGASSATIKGSIKGYETIDYVLGAKAGQTMSVTLKTNNGANYFNVLAPGSDAAIAIGTNLGNAWTGTLPVDGDYRIRVFLMRSAARRNEVAAYTLAVGINAPAGEARTDDAKVAGTAYQATGTVPCSVGTDPKGSAQCSFGVIRGAPGNAEVHLAAVGFDVTLQPDQVETVLVFAGDKVTSRYPNHKVTAEKTGDEWSIGVDGSHFYVIPEAVVNGG